VGLTFAAQTLPILLVGPYGGLVADRANKRRLLISLQMVMGVLAVALAVLTLTDAVRLWQVLGLAALLGLADAFEKPTRQAFLVEIVGPESVRNAVSLHSVMVNAARVLVPALLDDGTTAVFLVDPAAPGATRERVVATTFEPLGMLALRGVRVSADDVLGAPGEGAAIVEWMRQRGLAGVCATAAGVCGEALRLTAAHVSEREQFGQKIATFQAVAQRAADAYVDTRAIALTARQAAWRLAEGLPAAEALAIAKYWAADGGQRVAHAAQHLHGWADNRARAAARH
jgi:MFS family permease